MATSGPDGPIEVFDAAELDRILAARRFDLETLQPDPESVQTLRDFTIHWSDRVRDRPVYSLAWPSRLYIPGQADWRRYWLTPPPHENVYQHDWTGSIGAAPATFADNGSGYLAAVVSPATLSGTFRAWAGIALEYTPPARMSQVHFAADLTYLAIQQLAILTDAGYSRLDYFATVFLCGWEINAVSSTWERLTPFRSHPVFGVVHYGQQGGAPIHYPGSFADGALGVNFFVERGKRYAFGVVFQSTIIADVRERDERTPYSPRQGDTIALEARLGGSVPQMTVDTTVVYQA